MFFDTTLCIKSYDLLWVCELGMYVHPMVCLFCRDFDSNMAGITQIIQCQSGFKDDLKCVLVWVYYVEKDMLEIWWK